LGTICDVSRDNVAYLRQVARDYVRSANGAEAKAKAKSNEELGENNAMPVAEDQTREGLVYRRVAKAIRGVYGRVQAIISDGDDAYPPDLFRGRDPAALTALCRPIYIPRRRGGLDAGHPEPTGFVFLPS
jgi:hypothetical protein